MAEPEQSIVAAGLAIVREGMQLAFHEPFEGWVSMGRANEL